MTDKYEIKACPFCGEDKKVMVLIDTSDDSDDVCEGTWQVYCFSCKAGGPVSAEETVAVARWNYVAQTRAEREKTDESE